MKAALLKMTQGSSTPAVKGRQKSARGPVAAATLGFAVVNSDCLRFKRTVPKTASETMSPTSSKTTTIRQRAGTTSTTRLSRVSRAGISRSCVPESEGLASTDRASNMR